MHSVFLLASLSHVQEAYYYVHHEVKAAVGKFEPAPFSQFRTYN